MTSVRRIAREYTDAGSVNSLLAVWGFVTDQMFLTKAGHVGVVYRMAGVDFSGVDTADRRAIVHRYEAAVRMLDESCRVYQYLCKHRMEPITPVRCAQSVAADAIERRSAYLNARRSELYEIDLFLVLVYEGYRSQELAGLRLQDALHAPTSVLRQWFSRDSVLGLVEAGLDRAIGCLDHVATAFEVQ